MELNILHPAVKWNRETQTFSVELSDLGRSVWSNLCWNKAPIHVWNPETRQKLRIVWSHNDMDGSNEDCYGFNYVGQNPRNGRKFKFLFIND